MRLIDRDALMNNWTEKICWGVRCVDCPMLDAFHQCKIEQYFDEQPTIDAVIVVPCDECIYHNDKNICYHNASVCVAGKRKCE